MKKLSLDWFDNAPEVFRQSTVLDATAEEVFDILADVDQWELWFDEFEDATWLSEPPHGVGSRREVRLDIMSVREEFLAWEPGERYAFVITEATLPLATRLAEDYRLEPLAGGRCRLEWDVAYEPRWFAKPLRPAVRPIFGGMFQRAIRALADYVRSK